MSRDAPRGTRDDPQPGVDGVCGESWCSGSASNDVAMKGTFRNFNTIEDFRKVDHKKQLFDETVDRVSFTFPIFNDTEH